MSRRSLLRLGAAVGAGALMGDSRTTFAEAAGRDRDEETAALLHEFILRRVVPKTDPWIELHAVLALGSDFKRDGKNLLDELVADILRVRAVDLRRYPYFPLEVERHPFHVLQVMQASGVPRERVFVTPHGRYTHEELIRAGTIQLSPKKITDELSWVVSVLCSEFPPKEDRFVVLDGATFTVSEIVRRHLEETEAAYASVFAVMDGRALYAKSTLHARACNGLHLLSGLLVALRFGYGTEDGLLERVERLVEATLLRAQLEPVLIERAMPGDDEAMRLNREAANFTFLGHFIEVLGYSHRHEILALSSGVTRRVEGLRGQLAALTQRLIVNTNLDALSESVPQAYKLILGDACHAYRGIRFWT